MAPPRTRLLVLGVVRIFGPVHGYDVRRELLTWRMQDWMNIQPGSIYSALKTLEKDGLIAPVEDAGGQGSGVTGSGGPDVGEAVDAPASTGSPKRPYRVTAEGEKAFQAELRAAWWRVERAAEPLIPALCLLPFMPRAELIAAVGARVHQLGSDVEQLRFQRALIHDGATGADGGIPEHVREVLDFATARLEAEIAWSRTFLRRLEAGEYWFAEEGPPPDRPGRLRAGGGRAGGTGPDAS